MPKLEGTKQRKATHKAETGLKLTRKAGTVLVEKVQTVKSPIAIVERVKLHQKERQE